MANFPTSLDVLANPTSATFTDDPGYELDIVISDLNDIAEALEAKVGTGASVAAANTVLRGTATGETSFGKIVAADMAPVLASVSGVQIFQAGLLTTTIVEGISITMGKVAFVWLTLTAGANGTTNNAIMISLPASLTMATPAAWPKTVGVATFRDTSAANAFIGSAIAASTTTVAMQRNGFGDVFGTASDALQVQTNDQFSMQLVLPLA